MRFQILLLFSLCAIEIAVAYSIRNRRSDYGDLHDLVRARRVRQGSASLRNNLANSPLPNGFVRASDVSSGQTLSFNGQSSGSSRQIGQLSTQSGAGSQLPPQSSGPSPSASNSGSGSSSGSFNPAPSSSGGGPSSGSQSPSGSSSGPSSSPDQGQGQGQGKHRRRLGQSQSGSGQPPPNQGQFQPGPGQSPPSSGQFQPGPGQFPNQPPPSGPNPDQMSPSAQDQAAQAVSNAAQSSAKSGIAAAPPPNDPFAR